VIGIANGSPILQHIGLGTTLLPPPPHPTEVAEGEGNSRRRRRRRRRDYPVYLCISTHCCRNSALSAGARNR